MTRVAILGFVIAVSTFTGPTSAFAYAEGPWCLKAIIGRAEHNICYFRTFEQCLAERSFYGGQSFCGQNPRYVQYWRNRGQTKYPQ